MLLWHSETMAVRKISQIKNSKIILPFLKVQLLVTDSDVKNYTQIKADLDELRNLVEKSELWVYKEKKNDENRKKKASGSGKSDVRTML